MSDFQTELSALINKHSLENGSDTPDFILADYMSECLSVFHGAVCARELWYSRKTPGTMASTEKADNKHMVAKAQICEWKHEEGEMDGYFETSCGREYQATGGITDYVACPFCSRKLHHA